MNDIPDDIMKAAREVCRKLDAMPSGGNAFIVADEIMRRVKAERERCAKIAEHAIVPETDNWNRAQACTAAVMARAIRKQDHPND